LYVHIFLQTVRQGAIASIIIFCVLVMLTVYGWLFVRLGQGPKGKILRFSSMCRSHTYWLRFCRICSCCIVHFLYLHLCLVRYDVMDWNVSIPFLHSPVRLSLAIPLRICAVSTAKSWDINS